MPAQQHVIVRIWHEYHSQQWSSLTVTEQFYAKTVAGLTTQLRLSTYGVYRSFSEIRVNTAEDPLDSPPGGYYTYNSRSLVWQLDLNLQPTNHS